MRSKLGCAVHVLVIATLGAGCASAPAPAGIISAAPSVPLTAIAGPELALRWRKPELQAIDQPMVIAGLAIAVVADREQLFLVAIDPATGQKLWRQEIGSGAARRGARVRPVQIGDDKVAYLRPVHGASLEGYAELVIADVRSGRDLVKSPTALFRSPPVACGHETAVCITTEESGADRREHVRLELATGAYVVDNRNIPRRAGLMSVHNGAELFDFGDGPDNTLGLMRDGRMAWHLRFREAFPHRLARSDGLFWHLYRDPQVIVGSIIIGYPGNGRWVYELATDNATVGLSEATGKVLWRDVGSIHCWIGIDHAPVRCRSRGTVTYEEDGPSSFDNVAVTVEGFDPATGKTTWATPVGRAEDLAEGGHPPAIAGATMVAIARPERWLVLDYVTGAAAPAAPDATFWCMASAHYAYPRMWYRGVLSGHEPRPGGYVAFICNGDGKPGAVLPSADATFAAGAQIGSYAVLATGDGLLGFERRAPAAPSAESAPTGAPPAGK